MAFVFNDQQRRDMQSLADQVSNIQKLCTAQKSAIGDNKMLADELLLFVRQLRAYTVSIKSLKSRLNLNSTTPGSFSFELQSVIDTSDNLLSFVKQNIPSTGDYLLLFSIDANFDIIPREFTGAAVTALSRKIEDILGSIG